MPPKLRRQSCFSLTTMLFVILPVASRFICSLLIGSLLTACTSGGKKWNPEDYTVKSGDTIYSIAWRYELDPEEFAAWNGLYNSTFIKPGQRLHTRKPKNFKANSSRKQYAEQSIAYAPAPTTSHSKASNSKTTKTPGNKKWVKAKKGDSLYKLSKQYGVSVSRLAQLNQLKKPYLIQPGQTIFLQPLKTGRSSTKIAKTNTTRTSGSRASSNSNVNKTRQVNQTRVSQAKSISWPKTVRWQKPTNGKVVKKFSRRRNDAKGIDIAGRKGNRIVAAAKGKVVYSGNGLISYGNLIIIKHNKTFLSAYAYNRKLLVKEGDVVKAGQKIAEMGHKDKSKALLHFEIRKNGKPVDPLKYLPW